MEQFRKHGIDLKFLEYNRPYYDQRIKKFISGLSIIDDLSFFKKIRDDWEDLY